MKNAEMPIANPAFKMDADCAKKTGTIQRESKPAGLAGRTDFFRMPKNSRNPKLLYI